jgi:uncharacterized membrane protein
MKTEELLLILVLVGGVAAVVYFATRKPAPVVSTPAKKTTSVGSIVDQLLPVLGGLL